MRPSLLDAPGPVRQPSDSSAAGDRVLGLRSARRLWHCAPMDWKLFGSTFLAIFVAELGDKTQLATLSLAAGGSSRWVVFAGAALALVATSAIAVVFGEGLTRLVPPTWIRRGAGVLFLLLGILFLASASEGARG
jgi:putative Ca2+/H+ antiporter (TMEM165/GDT1 family)